MRNQREKLEKKTTILTKVGTDTEKPYNRQRKNPKNKQINKQTKNKTKKQTNKQTSSTTARFYFWLSRQCPVTTTQPRQQQPVAKMPRAPRQAQDTRRSLSGQAQPSPRTGVLYDDGLRRDVQQYPVPQQLQEEQQQQQGQAAQGPAAEDEVQIVDPTEVRNWK